MMKTFMQRLLASVAVTALGLSGTLVAVPAVGGELPGLTEKTATDAAKQIPGISAFGFRDGTLHLGVADDAAEAEAEMATERLREVYGEDSIDIVSGIVALQPYAADDAIGGMGYLVDNEQGELAGVCSAGFVGWDGAGNPLLLTAGHCAEVISFAADDLGRHLGSTTPRDAERPSTATANGGEGFDDKGTGEPGEWGYARFGSWVPENPTPKEDDIDFGVIELDSANYGVSTRVSDWTSAATDDLSQSTKAITSVGAHTPGTIQKSGRTTGLTSGTVFEEWSFEFVSIGNRWVHGFAVVSPISAPFSDSGDSGGGVFQGERAVGVISGGGDLGDGRAVSWVADLDYALEQSGVDFTLAPPAPVVSDQTIAPNGTIAGRATPHAQVRVSWGDPTAGEVTVVADADGNFSLRGPATVGRYDYAAVAIVDDIESEQTRFTVTVEDDAATEADTGAEATAEAEATEEADTTADADTSAEAEATAETDTDAEASSNADTTSEAEATTDADTTAEADTSAEATAQGDEAQADADDAKDGDAPAARSIVIDPREISASDFVQKNKGVKVAVTGFDEGESVTLKVVAGPDDVQGIELVETADVDGRAEFSVYGTRASDPSVYLGRYDVSVTGADDTAEESALTGAFEVVADDDVDGGSDLPRTGAELIGLATGAGLLVVGGAAIVLTRRRATRR